MPLDPSQFGLSSVADTCAVWNILSSKLLNVTAREAGCTFCCTAYVEYECLRKPRSSQNAEELELVERLEFERAAGRFATYHLAVDDLIEVEVLENRKRLGKGELSTIAFAKRTNQFLITDDQKARRLADVALEKDRVQTTPHLFGWLIFSQRLSDGDVPTVIAQHEEMKRPLKSYFTEMHQYALQLRLNALRR